MEIKISVKLTANEMFNFMMKHTYSSFSGYIGLLLSLCALLGFIATFNNEAVTIQYKIVLIVTALLFTVVQPVNLYLRSKKQVKENENINKPMEYVFTDKGIKVSQGEESAEYEWSQVYKIGSSKLSIFMYTGKYRSFILPRSAFAEGDIKRLRELVREKATSAKSVNFGRVE